MVSLPPEQAERGPRAAGDKGPGRNLLPGFTGLNVRAWTPEEHDLVRNLPAPGVARRSGRIL
jgi:hypothetical protein